MIDASLQLGSRRSPPSKVYSHIVITRAGFIDMHLAQEGRRTRLLFLLSEIGGFSTKSVHVTVSLCNPRWNMVRKKTEASKRRAMISTSVRDQQRVEHPAAVARDRTNTTIQSLWARWVFTEKRTVPEKQVEHADLQAASVNY